MKVKVHSKLAEIMEARGMKQKFICDQTGLGRNTVSEMVKGHTPSLGSALKVAKVLGLNVEYIWEINEE
jgi:transcriptional regulator with XRE-family HTH domain